MPSPSPSAQHELATLIQSRVPLIALETRDESRALRLLVACCNGTTSRSHLPVFQWTVTEGLRRIDLDLGGAQRHNAEPAEVLKSIRATDKPGVYVLLDFHPFLADPVHVRLLKDIAQGYEQVARTVVLLSYEVNVPTELEHLSARLRLALPDRAERQAIIERVATEWAQTHGSKVRTDRRSLELLVENLSGLSVTDTERLARTAVFDDGALMPSDLPAVMKAKYELLNRSGVLSFEYDTARFVDLAGMSRLKTWLQQRKPAFDGTAPSIETPKGLLLVGVQGCGKSLAAKSAAGIFGVSLLRLDFAGIHNKFVGESERNLRETLTTAETLAPCVLWIDEIEKGVATGEGDSGTSRRLLGTFLTWLAEKKTAVFVIATANDIAAVPPELIRKGRFDELFFVDLPNTTARAELLRIHTERRGLHLEPAELQTLAEACSDFSGAEIEQAIVSALYVAHARSGKANASDVLNEMRATRPLATVMAERISELREWARERTVPAE